MRVPLVEVGRTGRLDLAFGVREGKTVLLDSYCEVPFKITRPLSVPDPAVAHLMLMQCTPGLFGGDVLEVNVTLEPGARVVLTQQSATRVHPSNGRAATQTTRVKVAGGAELDLQLEPVIPFRGASLDQTMKIEVSEGASVVYWEGLMAGRVGRGEKWQFSEIRAETSLRCDNRLVYLDRIHLIPEVFVPDQRWVMDTCTYLATGIYFGSDAGRRAQDLHNLLPCAGVDSPAEHLAVLRLASDNGPGFHRARNLFGQASRARWSGAAL